MGTQRLSPVHPLMGACLVLVACSSGTAGPSTTATPTPATPAPTAATTLATGPTLAGTVSTRGDYWISSSFETRAEMEAQGLPTAAPQASTCAAYAAGLGGAGAFAAPEVHVAGGGSPLYVRATIDSGYTGPGTYNSAHTPALTGIASVTISTGSGAYQLYNSKKAGGTMTITVGADGSGTLSFADWGTDETRGGFSGGSLDGTVHWACH